ncbi:hypothetical protein Pcinc_034892, partial [Petrolisthes cinctipes]
QLLRGPRRVVRLCVFALLVPAALITIPLYVRLVLYPPASYPMMPTDQRLLSRHVSSLWCQAQTTHMNGTFTGYLSHGALGTQPQRRNHIMLNHLKLQDDIKEYWGFYLLKGSTITISSCAKWDGGQLMILRGIENLRRCAWIGEMDSSEDMEEDDDSLSNELHRQQQQQRQKYNGPRILSPTRPAAEESSEGVRMGYGIGNRAGGKFLERDLQADTSKGSLQGGVTVNEGEVLEGGISKGSQRGVTVNEGEVLEEGLSKGSLQGGVTMNEGEVLEGGISEGSQRGVTVKGDELQVNTRIEDNLEESLRVGELSMHGSKDDDDDIRTTEGKGNTDPLNTINSEERRQGITKLLRQAISMSRDKKEILRILHSEGRSRNGGGGGAPKNTLLQIQSSPNRRITAVFSEPRPFQYQSLQNESDDNVTANSGGNTESNTGYSNTDETRNMESIGRNITTTNFTDTDFAAGKTINVTKPSESIVNNTAADTNTTELTANRTTTMTDTDIRATTPHTTLYNRQGNGQGRKSRKLKGETRRGRLRKQNKSRRKKGTRRREENLTEEDLVNDREQRRQRRHLQQQQQQQHVEYEYEEVNEDDDGAFEVFDTEDELLGIMSETTTTTKGKQTKDKKSPTVENTVGGQIFFPEGLKFERGKFNQTTPYDNSREEHKSSYSSSEEALASCEGVIMTLPLIPFRGCSFHNALGINRIVYDIPITGTYYFVFSSDNEIYDNDLYFNLTMERVVYDVSKEDALCTNATHCTMPLHLWSSEQAVVEVPQESGWDNAYVLNTKCEPRVYVYLTLLLLVPLLIMCCAFH